MVNIVRLVHACLNSTNDFWKAENEWKVRITQAIQAQLLPMTTLKKCEMWLEKTEGWVFEQ